MTSIENSEQPAAVREVALLDCNSTVDDDDSQMAASFTSFDKIVNPNQSSKSCASPTSNCHSSYVDDAFLVSTTHTACKNVGEAAKAEHAKASHCALLAKDQLFGCFKELFSPEHEQERSVIVQNAVQETLVSIQTGLGSCNDQVDAVLITVFDQPVDEVQMRDSMDHSESVSFNEDLTVDSALQSTHDDRVPQSSRRVGSMATSGNKVVPQNRRIADESDEEPSSEMNLKRVSTTESEAASLLRFKEELYKSLDAKLDEVLSDNFEEPSLPSPPSLDEDSDALSDPPSRQDNSEKHDVEDDQRVDIEEELVEGAPVDDDDGVHQPTEEHNYRTVEIRDAVVDKPPIQANAFQLLEGQVRTPRDFQETRMEEQDSDARYEFSSPSMEEFDRLLRTDIEKLDHVGERRRNVAKSNVPMNPPNADSTANVVLRKADPVATLPYQQSIEFTSAPVEQVRVSPVPSAVLRTQTPTICLEDVVNNMSSSSTPLRDNRANEEEPEIVDLVHYKPGPRWLYNPPSDLGTRQQSFSYKYEEEVIDLTMYDEGF